MFSAIIVDDEVKVCALIQMLGDWERLGIEIIDICHDGEDALASILKNSPDIVITDIRMPVYDGLELIKQTQNAGLDITFIIISGFRHFEYAHRAMQYGIVDYLLKPIDQKELNDTLEKICQHLQFRNSQIEEKETLSKLIISDRQHHHKAFLNLLLADTPITENKNYYNLKYKTDFQYECFQVLLLNTNQTQLHIENISFQNKVIELAQRTLSKLGSVFVVSHEQGFFCFLNYSREQHTHALNAISVLYGAVFALSDIYGDFELSFGIGQAVNTFEQLPCSFHDAVLHEKAKLLLGWNRLITCLPEQCKNEAQDLLPNSLKRALNSALDTYNIDAIKKCFSDLLNHMRLQSYLNPVLLYSARNQLLDLLVPLKADAYLINDVMLKTDRAKNLYSFIGILSDFFIKVVKLRMDEKEQEEVYPIRLSKQYIQLHFSEPLSLETVAAEVKLTPVYFSSIFKKVTGQNFHDYLTQVRINEAKNLLKEPGKSIIEISIAVGYTDNKYFRKLFKKYTGIKPSDYRKLYI